MAVNTQAVLGPSVPIGALVPISTRATPSSRRLGIGGAPWKSNLASRAA